MRTAFQGAFFRQSTLPILLQPTCFTPADTKQFLFAILMQFSEIINCMCEPTIAIAICFQFVPTRIFSAAETGDAAMMQYAACSQLKPSFPYTCLPFAISNENNSRMVEALRLSTFKTSPCGLINCLLLV